MYIYSTVANIFPLEISGMFIDIVTSCSQTQTENFINRILGFII